MRTTLAILKVTGLAVLVGLLAACSPFLSYGLVNEIMGNDEDE